MRFLRLLPLFVRLSALNEMQYRINFVIQLVNSVLELVTGLGGLALVFYHTDSLGDWGPNELLAVVGVYTLLGGIVAVAIEPSMHRMIEGVRDGILDYTLTKPEDSQMLVSTTNFQLSRLGSVVLGIIVLAIAVARLGEQIGAGEALAFVAALLCGGAIIYSLWLMLATSAFWLTRVWAILEVFESLYQTGRWPIRIYPAWLRFGLTFIIPMAFAVTVPAEALTGRLTTGNLVLVIAIAGALLLISRLFWQFGVKHYSGASA